MRRIPRSRLFLFLAAVVLTVTIYTFIRQQFVTVEGEGGVVEVAVADRQRNALHGGFFGVRPFGFERRETVVAGASRDEAERGG